MRPSILDVVILTGLAFGLGGSLGLTLRHTPAPTGCVDRAARIGYGDDAVTCEPGQYLYTAPGIEIAVCRCAHPGVTPPMWVEDGELQVGPERTSTP